MGEAKNRGSREARVNAAMGQAPRPKPPVIVCNGCGVTLPEADAMDVRALPGIELAFRAHCGACDQDSWAVRGDAAAVKAFFDTLEKVSGQAVKFGTAAPGPAA